MAGGLFVGLASDAAAQRPLDVPATPTTIVGPITTAPTVSVLGLASAPGSEAGKSATREMLWMGVTQPLMRVGGVRFSALGTGQWLARNTITGASAFEGTATLRAHRRIGSARVWTAASYGGASLEGDLAGSLMGLAPQRGAANVLETMPEDTTVSRRVDVGRVGRAEAGIISMLGPVEFAVGMAFERASRVTTQTLEIDVNDALLPTALQASFERMAVTRTLRTLQQRELVTALATMGFTTGPTNWLMSVTAPVASWITSDALAPRPRVAPTVASLAVSQPLTGWFSIVGSASTSPTNIGTTALRDDITGNRRAFAPVFALGVRIARVPFRDALRGTPIGILGFETRLIGLDDGGHMSDAAMAGDSLRVQLVIDAPRAESVELMGDATEWTVVHMARTRDGRWRAELRLPPGVHRVSVRADGGAWIAPPGLPTGNDDYGTPVGVLVLTRPR